MAVVQRVVVSVLRTLRPAVSRVVGALPAGDPLPAIVWSQRHRWVVWLLATQAVALPVFALGRGFPLGHSVLEAALPAVLTAVACWTRVGRASRSAAAALGLMVSAGIVVHLWHGAIEAHFLFFVMVPIIALYESWVPFGIGIAYVLFQHGIVGTMASHTVYNHTAAHERPWTWAVIHAALFAAACVGSLVNWKLHEQGREQAASLLRLASHDGLTGLANRTVFHQRTEDALLEAETTGLWPSVVLLDLDGFKAVNDTRGHYFGDLLLAAVAARIRGAVRSQDLSARLGGDEFGVLLGGATDPPVAAVERIRSAFELPFSIEGATMAVRASIGVAHAAAGDDTNTLLQQADADMYAQKQPMARTTLGRPAADLLQQSRCPPEGGGAHAYARVTGTSG